MRPYSSSSKNAKSGSRFIKKKLSKARLKESLSLNAASINEKRSEKSSFTKATIAFILLTGTFLLFPGAVATPRSSPGESHSYDASSAVALLATQQAGDGHFSANLFWNWDDNDARNSQSSITAVITSENAARGSLVFGGPIASASSCYRNGDPAVSILGIPDELGFAVPSSALIWLEERDAGAVTRIDFEGDASGAAIVIRCEVNGFSSDSPPLHRVYTPHLLAYSPGNETAHPDSLRINRICVNARYDSKIEDKEDCAEMFKPVPSLGGQEVRISVDTEQYIRDVQLLIMGAIAGIAGSTLFEVVPLITVRLTRGTRRLRKELIRPR